MKVPLALYCSPNNLGVSDLDDLRSLQGAAGIPSSDDWLAHLEHLVDHVPLFDWTGGSPALLLHRCWQLLHDGVTPLEVPRSCSLLQSCSNLLLLTVSCGGHCSAYNRTTSVSSLSLAHHVLVVLTESALATHLHWILSLEV